MDSTPTADFLACIWGNGPHSVCWMDPANAFVYNIVPDPDAVLRHLADLQGVDTWIGAHPLRAVPQRGRGDRDDIAEIVAIPADLDWAHETRRTDDPLPSEADVRQWLALLGRDLQPSIIVHSGHGLQPWWLLSYPIDPPRAEELIAQLGAALHKVGLTNGREDLASILRLPGTRNHKGGWPVDVVVEALDPKRRFTPEWLHKHLPPPSSATGRGGGTRHRLGAVTSDQQALANLLLTTFGGHSPDVWRDGSIHLVRPGKPAKDGSSASIIVGDQGDAILTVFSDHWPGLTPGSYVLGIDGVLHHPSDITARITINAALTPQGPLESEGDRRLSTPWIDWSIFAKRDSTPQSWLVEKFWPAGRGMALWAGAKEGKSELVLWCAGNLAMGIHPWTGDPIESVPVAYFDFEMTEDDLEERLDAFGFAYDRLDSLYYFLLPPMHALDTEAGGEELIAAVHACGARAVVIDTLSRVVTGDENQADTIQRFYRHTGIRLKKDGIAYVRLDHAGKNTETNSPRGSSAKRDDVDVIWRQKRTDKGVQLDCTNGSRLSWVGPHLTVDRIVDPKTTLVRYSMPVQLGWTAQAIEKARELDAIGAPVTISKADAIAALKAAGKTPGRITVLLEAIKCRLANPSPDPSKVPGTALPPQGFPDASEQAGTEPADLFDDQP